MEKLQNVSAYVITRNEAKNIERALKSLSFVNDIVVVDSGSEDDTVEIAKRYTGKVHHRDWTGFSDQRNYAMDQCENDWVIALDADEEITDACREAIVTTFREGTDKTWFKIRRKEFHNGKLMRFGADNPSYQIRILRKSKGRYKGDVHEYPRMEGAMGVIEEPINHFYTATLSEVFTKGHGYSRLAAEEKFANGERKPYLYKYFSAGAQFVKAYLFKLGCLDGFYGLVRALGSAHFFYTRQGELYKLWQEKGKG